MNERQQFAYDHPLTLAQTNYEELQAYRRMESIGFVQDFGEVWVSTALSCSRDPEIFDGVPFWQASGAFVSDAGQIPINLISEHNQTALASNVVLMTGGVGLAEKFYHVIVGETSLQYFKRFTDEEAASLSQAWCKLLETS